MNMDDLSMLLREQKVYSIKDVENAIFEANGKLSIMLKPDQQPITKQDQNILSVQPKYMPTTLVTDGKVVDKNLQANGITLDWLTNQLNASGLSVEDVFFVELQVDGTLYIDKWQDNKW